MDEIKLRKILLERGIDIVNAETIEQKSLEFERALRIIIRPRTVSDRTSFRNITLNGLQRNAKKVNSMSIQYFAAL